MKKDYKKKNCTTKYFHRKKNQENEDKNNSDTDHDVANQSTDESQNRNGANLTEINESFIDQKNNLVYFINQQECPCDSDARTLQEKIMYYQN